MLLLRGVEILNPKSTLLHAKVNENTTLNIMRKPSEDYTSDDDPPDLIETSEEEPPRRQWGVRDESESDESDESDDSDAFV